MAATNRFLFRRIVLGAAILLILLNLIFNFNWAVPFGRENLGGYLNILAMVLVGLGMVLSERDERRSIR